VPELDGNITIMDAQHLENIESFFNNSPQKHRDVNTLRDMVRVIAFRVLHSMLIKRIREKCKRFTKTMQPKGQCSTRTSKHNTTLAILPNHSRT